MMLNGKLINPAELRTRISLRRPTTQKAPGGFQSKAYETAAEVRARWTNVHSSEVWQSQIAQAVQPATVLIRYRADIDVTWQVVKGGEAYQITSLDDIQERHEYIELKVQRGRGA